MSQEISVKSRGIKLKVKNANHPIRALALDPNVPKLIKDRKVVEVWGTLEQMPWRNFK